MSKRDEKLTNLFHELGSKFVESIRSSVEKYEKDINEVAHGMGIPNNSLFVDIMIPQVVAIIFMAGLKDSISDKDFSLYSDAFTGKIKKDIYSIRKFQLNKESE